MKLATLSTSLLALCLLSSPSLTHARSLADIQSSKTLTAITTASAPPHGFLEPKSGKLEGIMVEVVQQVAKHLNTEAQISDVAFAGLIPSLTSGRVDIMSAPLFITPERSSAVDFSDPVYEWGEGLVLQENTDKSYANLDALAGAKVGVLVDSVQFNMLKDMPNTRVTTYKDYATLMADLRAGRIDAGVIDPPSIAYQIRARGVPGVKLDNTYQPDNKWYVGLAVEKGNQELLNAVNNALATMRENGEMAQILENWGVVDLMSRPNP